MPAEKRAGRARAQDVDRHVGARMRERRIMLGLTQHQMAELIGVTYQQAQKYEKGINRVAAGRLYHIAQALGVEVGYFFEGLGRDNAIKATPQQRMLLELARNVISIPERKHKDAVCSLARALAEPDAWHEPRVLVAPEKVVTVDQLHIETHTATDRERLVEAGVRLWLSPESSAP